MSLHVKESKRAKTLCILYAEGEFSSESPSFSPGSFGFSLLSAHTVMGMMMARDDPRNNNNTNNNAKTCGYLSVLLLQQRREDELW